MSINNESHPELLEVIPRQQLRSGSSSAAHHHHHAVETTPQMLTLGRSDDFEDAIDYRIHHRPRQQEQHPVHTSSTTASETLLPVVAEAVPTNSSMEVTESTSTKSGWFSRLLGPKGGGEPLRDVDDEYDAMGDSERNTGAGADTNSYSSSPRRSRIHPLQLLSDNNNTQQDAAYAAILENSSTLQDNREASLEFRQLHPTQQQPEDALQQDCAFFFRSTDVLPPVSSPKKNNYYAWKAMRRTHRHSELFEYSDAVDVVSPPVLQKYRTRYAQLNQELRSESTRKSRHDIYYETDTTNDPFCHNQYDLHLEQQQNDSSNHYDYTSADDPHIPTNQNRRIVRTDTVNQSSLFYEANGKLLMRLPRDQVRLLMDPDLEAGILSVEQWRPHQSDDDDDTDAPIAAAAETKSSILHHNDDDDPPPLRYVLTVNEDLYRKIVAEMSPSTTKYFCCSRACCNEEEKADIRIALLLLGMILLILLINTFAFHEN
jgi:hypothetical protein